MKLENFKYKLLTAIRYLGDAFFYPFFALYLKSTELGESKIGLLLSISPLLGIILNPIYTKICKNVNVTKKLLGILSILEGATIVAIAFSKAYYLLFILTIILAIFGSCHYALMDSLVATYSHVHHINYSSIRLFGSGAYVAATFLAGKISDLSGYVAIFLISAGLFVLSGINYLCLKHIEYREDDYSDIKIPFRELFKNKPYVLFLIFYGLLYGAIFTSSSYLSTYLEFRGVSKSEYGLVYSYFVGVETITLIILNLFKKHYRVWFCMILSALTVVIRMIFYYVNAPILAVEIVTGIRGIGFAIVLHTAFSYVIHLVGEKAGQRGIMVTQLWYAICLTIFNNINGNIIENHGYDAYHLFMLIVGSILTIYAVVMEIISLTKKKNTNQLEKQGI